MAYYQKSSSQRTNRYRKKPSQNEWLHILLFYVLPFIVVNAVIFFCVTTVPKATITLADTKDYLTVQATVKINSWFPTKSIVVSMDAEVVEVEKGKKRTYTTSIAKNGVLEVTVENINGMVTTVFEHINVLDDLPPTIDSTDIDDGIVTLTISDSQSGVNFESIYALNSKNERIQPLTAERSSTTLSYEMDSAGLSVFAQDKAGNEVQCTFTSHKEGDEELLEGGVVEPVVEGEAEAATQESSAEASTTPQVSIP